MGRKSIGKEDDDLDNMLDDIEEKRGIESTKQPEVTKNKRAKTAGTRSGGFGGLGTTALDDDLDDDPAD